MSLFQVEIVPVNLEPHPHADALSIVKVYDYTVCVRTDDWKGITKAAYIPPESIVPDNELFAFLQGNTRIKVRLLRGIVSMGLLIPAPEGSEIGENVADILGITHYEPTFENNEDENNSEPPPVGIISPIYDVENMLRYSNLFQEGEQVYITEKIHGVNARFVWHDNRMWCGSKEEWKRKSEKNMWWCALNQNPWIEKYCQAHPSHIVYCEIFGSVHALKYGTIPGQYQICVFDILINGKWLPTEDLFAIKEIKTVPLIGINPFNLKHLQQLAEGNSLIKGANHMREGIIVRPINERTTKIGRLLLKIISNTYLNY